MKIMKKVFISAILLAICIAPLLSLPNNEYVVPLCRNFTKELFEPNAEPFLSPTLSVVNATTNSGFYHSAYVPAKVDKPYFRITLNLFYGPISNSMKTFSPTIPSKEFNMMDALRFGEYTSGGIIRIKDTVALLNYMFLNLIDMGMKDGSIQFPKESATLLGNEGAVLYVQDSVLQMLLHKHPLYPLLPNDAKQLLDSLLDINSSGRGFLGFTLPEGGRLNSILAGVPQLEIGSLFGTELLVRFIPKINFGEYIGDFSFWGVGLKHSISQYFYEDKNRDGNNRNKDNVAPFDLSVQAVYQRTSLVNANKIKVIRKDGLSTAIENITQSVLSSNANIYCFNVNASKQITNWLEFYTGLSYELLNIDGKYEYYLPISLQYQIGLVDYNLENDINTIEAPEYPGDQDPQTTNISLSQSQFKFTFGAAATLGRRVTLFLDYSITNFPVLSTGLQVRF